MSSTALLLAGVLVLGASAACRSDAVGSSARPSLDPVARACKLPARYLVRIWRGHVAGRSEDVTFVPRAPNYVGSFDTPSHTGPWDYVQRVPLLLYGPRHIARRAPVPRHVNLTDIYPTVARLLHAPLPERDGHVLFEALQGNASAPPRLVVTVMWDGVGTNVLARWPGRWPALHRLSVGGTYYTHATVGSSPSITPTAHSTVGTGAWPRHHGVSGIQFRAREAVSETFDGVDPGALELKTYADLYDRILGNDPRVAFLGWQAWHLGMLGSGRAVPGGDADIVGLIGWAGGARGNRLFYSTPDYVRDGTSTFASRMDELDRADGRLDGKWRGHRIPGAHESPAWAAYESDLTLEVLRRGRFGRDVVPDLYFANFKMTDIAGHHFTMDSQEMAEDLRAQDAALARIVAFLDDEVGDYVLILSADHGHTPAPRRSGAWPISQAELIADLDRHFGAPPGHSLVEGEHAVGLFLDREALAKLGVTEDNVAAWLSAYTLRENWPGDELPEGYVRRADEKVLAAAFLSTRLGEVMRCAFGSRRPPQGFPA